jgi:hypothetical protein
MSKLNGWAMAAAVAITMAPMAFGAERPTKRLVVASDGYVYYPDPTAGTVVRVAPDGSSEIVANGLDTPTGVDLDYYGDLLIGDEVGIRRVLLQEGVLETLRTLPTDEEPSVSFVQSSWKYKKAAGTINLVFEHNLSEPLFKIEVSKDGGYTWTVAATKVKGTSYLWKMSSEDRDEKLSLTSMRFRVTACVDGHRVASDVSDLFENNGR